MDPSFPNNNNANVPAPAAPAQPVSLVPVGAPNGELQPQQQQLMPNVGAANAVQQALAAFQASVEAAAVAAAASNPAAAAAPPPAQQQQQQQQQPPQPLLTMPAAAPTMMPAPGAALFPGTTAEAQQQLWQQAWLSAILPAQQAALTQPYLAAALNPLQQQQAQQPAQQQPQQQQAVMSTLPPAPISTVPTTADMAAAAAASVPSSSKATKRKAGADTTSASTTSRPTKKQQQQGGPSVISATSTSPHMLDADAKPPAPKTEAELAVMTPAERRRYERNLREQQRSYKISQQIKQLRDVLHESNIPFRPNKYSILVSVADYIKQLQSRAIMLDSEHQRLIDTIRNTTERVNNESSTASSTHPTTTVLEADAPLVQGIDYQAVFRHCYFPLAVATLDGRVLRCNTAMERLLRAAPLADQSFFVFIRNHQEVFEAMAALLKRSTATIETGEGTVTRTGQLLFWCGHILAPSNETVCTTMVGSICQRTHYFHVFFFQFPFTITLTNDAADNPKYFSLSAAASPEI